MSRRFVSMSATGLAKPTPALFTSTSRRPKRSRCSEATFWISSSSREVGGDGVDFEPFVRQPLGGALELLGAARRERDGEAFLAEHLRDREADAGRCPGDDRRACCHFEALLVFLPR